MQVTPDEQKVRIDLACCYRLVADFGWEDLVYTHLSARVPGPDHHFLINPYGMLFSEIKASDLVKIDLDGNIVSDTPYGINKAGFTIHSAVHAARKEALCVMHVHTVDGAAVSAQEKGLLPLTQNAVGVLYSLSYHDYEGPALNLDERPRLVADLGDNELMLLRNHGTLTVGRTIGHAFANMHRLEKACSMQIAALSGGVAVRYISQEIIKTTGEFYKRRAESSGDHLSWPALKRKMLRLDPSFME